MHCFMTAPMSFGEEAPVSFPDPRSPLLHAPIGGAPTVRDSADGFVYDATNNTIALQGAACDAVKQQPVPTVQVIFGCPPDGGPPIVL